MNRLKLTMLALGILIAAWIMPPVISSIRHLCPARPDAVSQAVALPAFARKYGISCMQCHTAFPYLNDYGRQFKMNGYVREKGSDEGVIKSADGKLSIERLVPWAVIARSRPFDNGKSSISNGGTNMGGSDGSQGFKIQAINDIDMFIAGGDAARNISYFGELDANVNNFTPASGDLQFGYHPFSYVNFILARRGFYAMDPYQTIMGNESPTVANRALDGGLADQNSLSGNTLGALTQTAMVYGLLDHEKLGSLYYAAGASGGNGDDKGKNAKNGHIRLAYDTDKGFMIGGFGSFGHEMPGTIPANGGLANTPAPAPQTQVKFVKTGMDTLLEWGNLAGRAAFLYSFDKVTNYDVVNDPLAINGFRSMTDRAAYVEAMYVYKRTAAGLPFLVPLIRENWYSTYNGTRQFNYITAQVAHYFASNLKAFVEYSFDTKADPQGDILQGASASRVPRGNRLTGQIEVGF